jgi:hypothetical protein
MDHDFHAKRLAQRDIFLPERVAIEEDINYLLRIGIIVLLRVAPVVGLERDIH